MVRLVGLLLWLAAGSALLAPSVRRPLAPRHKLLTHFASPIAETPSDDNKLNLVAPLLTVAVVLPSASGLFGQLLSTITDFDVTAADRQTSIIELLLLKRVYLYTLAIAALDWCSKRSVELAEVPLGERFMQLNKELLANLGEGLGNSSSVLEAEARPLYEALDRVEGGQQAAALPLLLAASLAGSFALLALSSRLSGPASADSAAAVSPFAAVLVPLLPLLPLLGQVSSGAVVFLFSKSELEALQQQLQPWLPKQLPAASSTALAAALSAAALLCPLGGPLWPAQNAANVLVAATVCRAATLSRLRFVLPALLGLVLYDVLAVAGTAQFTDGGQSVMEAVARARIDAGAGAGAGAGAASVAGAVVGGVVGGGVGGLAAAAGAAGAAVAAAVAGGAGAWRPGLFEVVVGGRVSDALGLADVVFPALLAGWALRFDAAQAQAQAQTQPLDPSSSSSSSSSTTTSPSPRSPGLYPAALAGFAVGCVLLELLQTGAGGQPALLYLVPAMGAALLAAGARAGVLREMWAS